MNSMAQAGWRAGITSVEKTRAASRQRIGRMRLPPAKTEYRMASWIEGGGATEEGSRRSRAASTNRRFCSKKSGSFIEECSKDTGIGPESSGFGLAFGFEGLGDHPTVGFAEKNLDFAFGFF